VKRLSRRQLGLGLLAIGASFGGYAAFKWFFGDPTEVTLAILRRRVGYLNVSAATLERFAADYAAWKGRRQQLARLSILALPLRVATPYDFLGTTSSLRRLEDSVVSQFLMSTDFFFNNADTTQPVTYLGFYEPMSAVCRNPLWRPVGA
jgi:hypothetical protein